MIFRKQVYQNFFVKLCPVIFGTIITATLLSGCEKASDELAHSSRPYPPLIGWQGEQFKAFSLCAKRAPYGVTINGVNRSCVNMHGLSVKVSSTSPELNASVYGMCKIDRNPVVVSCSVENSDAQINSINFGNYRDAYKLCNEALYNARLHENREPSKVVALNYGVLEKDLDKTSPYSLKLAVKWGVFDPERSNAKRPGAYFSIQRYERNRVTCDVDNYEVVKLSYRALGNVTWNEKGLLNHYGFFKR